MTAIRGALLVVLILVGAGSASAYNLHGPAVCSGTPMVGATIEAIDTTLQTSAGVSVTDGGGEYALSLAAGFYDLAVTPPEGSPCDATVIRNRHVTADELYQIILVMQDPGPNPTITFTGSIVDDLGNPIPEIQVTLSGVGDNYREFRGYSNASGQYAITVEVTSEMTFHLELRSEYNNIPALPQYFNCSGETLTLTGSSIYDITLPFEAIGGHVALNDTGTPPIAGAYVNAYGSGTAGTFSCSSYGGSAATDANGDYGPIYVFGNGSATVGVGAVARSYYGASQVVDTTPVGPSVADFVLEPDATVFAQVSGTITGFGGAPLQGMRLEWESDSGYINATTDAAGHYAVEVPPGDYSRLTIRDDYGGLANAPNQYLNCGNNVTYAFTGVHVVDLDIPVSVVAGHVSVAPDTPAANASINASSSVTVGDIGCSGSSRATADANGDFSGLYVLSGASVTLGSSVPFGGPYSGGTATVTDLVADGSVSGVELVHTPLQTYPVSGTVTGYGGAPVSGLSVRMVGPSGYVSAGTDAAGHYTMNVLPGTYSEIELQYYGGGSSSLQNPQDFSCSSYSTQVEVTGDGEVVQDFALPIRRVTGTVTTSASIPIEGVSMYVNTNGSVGGLGCNGNTNGVVSDENGHYELYVFAGNSNFYFYPPSGSGFLSTSFGSPTPEDLSQQLVLPLPDIVAPTLTGEPVVIHHSNTSVSIQWGTNEATNTRLEYGPGSTLPGAPTVLTKPAYVTDHVVTLTGLDTETQYAFQVTSKDAAGNAVTSGVITFTTLVEADADAPVIVSGPTVTYLAPTQIRVSWQTNEPATSYVDWQVAGSGNVVTSGNGESALLHDVLLTGLSPLTTYSLTVASSDPDGNGPTVEGPLDVTTPDVLDTTPPAVSALRTECVTDTRMAVCWDTSEAADSNVAYTNQSSGAASALSASPLVTSRCMSLQNLSANTTYAISVSSRDGGGNAGTGGPITQTTAADASVGAPVISGFTAEYASPTSALVRWTTDVSSSSFVRWGTNPANLDRTAGDVASSETSHAVLVTGLPAGTTVYVQASATNPCLQTTTVGPDAVVDVDECETPDLCGAGGECFNTVGSYRCERPPTVRAGQTFAALVDLGAGGVIGQVIGDDADGGALTFALVAGNDDGAFALSASGGLTVGDAAAFAAHVGGSVALTVQVTDNTARSGVGDVTVTVNAAFDPCDPSPCAHGACSAVGEAAACDCAGTGYSGTLCDADVDECGTANGGCDQTCENLDGTFACGCDQPGYVLGDDGHSCVVLGACGAAASCDPALDVLVFYGVVEDADGNAVGSIRCERDSDGEITCDADEDGVLAVSDTLWCE